MRRGLRCDGAVLLLYGFCVLIVFCCVAIWNEGKVTINNGAFLPSMRLKVHATVRGYSALGASINGRVASRIGRLPSVGI